MAELAEDETNLLRSSLERSYEKVRADIAKELEDERRAIDADKADEDRIADLKDLTKGGNPRRTAPETKIPQNAPRLGSYGESVIFGQPSPDQIKAAVNLEYEGKDFSKRIWGDTEKLARELKDIMQSAIINGEGAEETARKLSQRMGVHFSHCLRLVRTEHNRIMNQAQLDQMRDAEVKYYIFKAIHDSRTCGHCTRLDGKRVKIDEVKTGVNCPPIHPSCRCTFIPDFGNGGGDGGDGNGGSDTSWISDLFRKHLGEDATDAAREAQTETGTASASSAQTAPEKAPQASNATVATASSAQTSTVATASSADARPPEPKGKDRKKKAEDAGVQRTIEQYLKELEAREAKNTKQAQAIEKATDKARNFPTAENIEAVAELQDTAMLTEEQAQQAAIGAQRKAIEAGKAVKQTRTKATTANYLKEERRVITDTNGETVSTRPNNDTDGAKGGQMVNQNGGSVQIKTSVNKDNEIVGDIRRQAEKIKKEYQANRTPEKKALIRELIESGRKVTPENIVTIAKGDGEGIVWIETGTKSAGLQHILERHGHDFKNKGIEQDQIPSKVIEIATKGELITGTVSATGQKGVLLKMNEDLFIISIGTNGFIVGCYPIGRTSKYEKTSYDDGLTTLMSVGIRRSGER